MKKNIYQEITKKNTKTFYYSTLFFPKKIRDEIFILYSFVRIIDNFVDEKKPNKKNFYLYKKKLNQVLKKNEKSKIKIVNDFGQLVKKYNLHKEVEDYIKAQEKELKIKKYKSEKEFNLFTYGVAGTVGLMMAKILNLPKKTYKGAIKLGQALQIINNIRDIFEDYQRKKVYLSEEILKKFNLSQKNFLKNENFQKLKKVITYYLNQSFKLYREAKKEFKSFSNQNLFPVSVASDLYLNIAKKILKKPKLIFEKEKLKPNIFNIIKILIKRFILIYGFNKKN
ncbi:MAG: squalene/phytoene synthase family protein [Microgenomates group bacterium]